MLTRKINFNIRIVALIILMFLLYISPLYIIILLSLQIYICIYLKRYILLILNMLLAFSYLFYDFILIFYIFSSILIFILSLRTIDYYRIFGTLDNRKKYEMRRMFYDFKGQLNNRYTSIDLYYLIIFIISIISIGYFI